MFKLKKARKLYTTLASIGVVAVLIGIFVFAQEADPENPGMFRKNVSKSEYQANAKAKLNMMTFNLEPALTADGTETTIDYYDQDGVLVREGVTVAKPLIVTYTEATGPNGEHDVFAAVSRDDGETWKRQNISRMADKSSFTLENGTPYYGHCVKPVMQVKGRYMFVAWSSKYAKGGRPRYAIIPEGDPEDDYEYDNPYYVDDIWGVGGSQRSIDYDEEYPGEFPGVGEIPFSAVWICRGYISATDGRIVWFKPERLTSARRDAIQLFTGGAPEAGFAVAWQEDPEGLNPGKGLGPGEGWSGAIANKGTDIWYSYISWGDFATRDFNFPIGGDPDHNLGVERPKALVPMSLPVRISDNEMVNTINADFIEAPGEDAVLFDDTDLDGYTWDEGTHAYVNIDSTVWPREDGKPYDLWDNTNSEVAAEGGFYTFTNSQGVDIEVAITKDGRLLDGNSAATRVNLNLQKYKRSDGSVSAWAIMAYEETHGGGTGAPTDPGTGGPDDDYVIEEGKSAIYHTFDFKNPDLVSAGNIVNLQETDEDGNLLFLRDESGNPIYDWRGEEIPAYENARRPRFVLQGKSAMGTSKTIMIILYKEGKEGMGRPSDIMMRRFVVGGTGNPYAFKYLQPGFQNVSTMTPLVTTDASGVSENDERLKVLEWEQTVDNLLDRSGVNPYEDARAHRGSINGDFLTIGYSYTPNWAAARNYNDKYNFYIRRSFDGGQTWTTDPEGDEDVEHTEIFLNDTVDPGSPDRHYEVYETFGPGDWEPAHNVSLMKNNFESVIEPRIVKPLGTITSEYDLDEDLQNKDVVFFAYGTEANDDTQAPLDLFWSFTYDRGQTLLWSTWIPEQGPNAGVEQVRWPWLASSGGQAHEDREEGETQLREVPSGERMYACWLQEEPDEDGYLTSDVYLRRILPFYFLPESYLVFPEEGMEIYGEPELLAEAYDDRPIENVLFYIREPVEVEVEGELVEELTDIGYEDMPGMQDPEAPEMWKLLFNTQLLHDGPFVLMAKATDKNGNFRWSDPVNVVVRNTATLSRLPSSSKNKAGRTMPVKFSLRTREEVDPTQPFVYHDGLAVDVYKVGYPEAQLLQTFVFGEGDDYYRIDTTDEIYIANFVTEDEPAQYFVEVRQLSNDFILGSFSFETR